MKWEKCKGETYGSKLIENTNDLASLINITFNENSAVLKGRKSKCSTKKGTTNILRNYVFWRK
ncbi:hypothetical protein ACOAJ8_10775 [Arcobacter cryaerophilus gv. pseudocryaerophilus]